MGGGGCGGGEEGGWGGGRVVVRNDAEGGAGLPRAVGPPGTVKRPRGAAGELLLAMGRAKEARVEFQKALARTPRRTVALLGLARSEWAMGNRAAARKDYKELRSIWHSADTALAELAEARGRGAECDREDGAPVLESSACELGFLRSWRLVCPWW